MFIQKFKEIKRRLSTNVSIKWVVIILAYSSAFNNKYLQFYNTLHFRRRCICFMRARQRSTAVVSAYTESLTTHPSCYSSMGQLMSSSGVRGPQQGPGAEPLTGFRVTPLTGSRGRAPDRVQGNAPDQNGPSSIFITSSASQVTSIAPFLTDNVFQVDNLFQRLTSGL